MKKKNFSLPYTPSDLIVISDLDGTFLNSDGEVSPENLDALREFIRLGGRFGIASGRTERPMERLGIPTNVPSILYNGSVLYDLNTDEVLWYQPLEEYMREITRDLILKFPGVGVEIITLKGIYLLNRSPEAEKHLNLEKLIPTLEDCQISDIPEEWIKIMIEWPTEKLLEVQEYLDELTGMPGISFNYAFSLPYIIEVNHAEADKGVALRQLAKHLGVGMDHLIAMGDNLNDLPMLRLAGTVIVPENAEKEAKEIASFVSVPNDGHIMCDLLRLAKAAL